jgi:hypothetical protein
VVEEPGMKEKKAFHNLHELWDILNPMKGKQLNHRKTKVTKRGDGKSEKG